MKTASSTFSSSWLIKHTLLGLGIIAILTGSVLLTKSHLSSYFAPTSYGIGGLLKVKEIDLLFIGSSHTRQSYNVALIEKKCNCKAYALAYSGMDPHLMYIYLSYLKTRNDLKIKKIVFEAYSFKLIADPSLSDSRIYSEAPFELKLKLLESISSNVPGMDFRKLFNLVVNENNESLIAAPVANYALDLVSYKGGYKNKVTGSLSEKEFSELHKVVSNKLKYIENDIQIQSLKKIQDLYNSTKIIFVDPPMPEPITHNAITSKAMIRYKEIIEGMGYKYLAPWYGLERARKPSNFQDWNHLSNIGRDIFSEEIVDKLALKSF
ncbi:MAG TPA: hypothetical protein VNJ08_01820 [Bacteriovoracaceae bacterium]|nr:hypothetical protein [Bacteriovoracaceae bacterium]